MELIGQNKIVIFSSHQMSYVEEFCKDIVIINKGDVVLSGDLDNIKREFGKNQLIVSAVDKTLDEPVAVLINDKAGKSVRFAKQNTPCIRPL